MPPLFKAIFIYLFTFAAAVYLVPLVLAAAPNPGEAEQSSAWVLLIIDSIGGIIIGRWLRAKHSVGYISSFVILPTLLFVYEFRTLVIYAPSSDRMGYAAKQLMGIDCGSNECLDVSLVTMPLLSAISCVVGTLLLRARSSHVGDLGTDGT